MVIDDAIGDCRWFSAIFIFERNNNNMIRKHEKEDLEQILKVWLHASTLAHPFLEDDFVEKVKKDMRTKYIPGSETWVYEESTRIVGFVSMAGNEIAGLFVSPNHHARGYGTQLVDFVAQVHETLEVEVFKDNVIGRAFYDKYGFEIIKDYFEENSRCQVLRMKWRPENE